MYTNAHGLKAHTHKHTCIHTHTSTHVRSKEGWGVCEVSGQRVWENEFVLISKGVRSQTSVFPLS